MVGGLAGRMVGRTVGTNDVLHGALQDGALDARCRQYTPLRPHRGSRHEEANHVPGSATGYSSSAPRLRRRGPVRTLDQRYKAAVIGSIGPASHRNPSVYFFMMRAFSSSAAFDGAGAAAGRSTGAASAGTDGTAGASAMRGPCSRVST